MSGIMALGKPISIRLEAADEAELERFAAVEGSTKGAVAKQILEAAIAARASGSASRAQNLDVDALADAVSRRLADRLQPFQPSTPESIEHVTPLLRELVRVATESNAEVTRLRSDLAAFAQMFEEPPGTDPPEPLSTDKTVKPYRADTPEKLPTHRDEDSSLLHFDDED